MDEKKVESESAPIVSAVEVKPSVSEEKKEPVVNVEPKKDPVKPVRRALRKTLIAIFVVLLILIVGIFLGAFGYPRVYNWLVDHNFIEEDAIRGSSSNNVDISEFLKDLDPSEQEGAIISVIETSKNSVVSIAVSKIDLQAGQGVIDQSVNIGSGFIVDKSGLIITNQHVVSDLNVDYKVVTNDGKEYDVKEVVRDDVNDIALLKIEAKDLNALALGDSERLVPGQTVIAIGTPLGDYAGSVTTGVISGLHRSVTTGQGSFLESTKVYEDVLQTDAAINPGNSGGPLLNTKGEVIGVNFATTSGADNISFALPINRVSGRIAEYRKYGKFIKPFFGIEYQMISKDEARFYKDVVPGALVARVGSDSPAEKAGIKKLDIVTEIEGEPVLNSFSSMIQEHKVGDKIKVKVFREGKYLDFDVTLEEAK